MHTYLLDYEDVFPTAADQAQYGNKGAFNWIEWTLFPYQSGGAAPDPALANDGVLARYLGNQKTNILTCPSDQKLITFRQNPRSLSELWSIFYFFFSYQLSSPEVFAAEAWQQGTVEQLKLYRHGMASTPGINTVQVKLSSIPAPATKVMFAEQLMPFEIGASEMAARGSGWMWPKAKITRRHSNRGNTTLGDGHVETVRPDFAERPEHYDPLFEAPP